MAEERSFYSYYKQNMEQLGLPAPDTYFGTYERAIATTVLIVAAIEKFGTGVTIGELVGATVLSEKLLIIGALGAVAYVGACLGSLAVATGRYTTGGYSISDLFACADEAGIPTPIWLRDHLGSHPDHRGAPIAIA